MDADRFDTLSRSLDAWPRRHALRAIAAIGMAGLVDRLGAKTARAKKKKKKTALPCPTCPTCPPPITCPQPDTCPKRACCVCKPSAPTPGCVMGGAASTPPEANAICDQVCGSADNVATTGLAFGDNAIFCNDSHTNCQVVGCPI
jgi:hypothetical protein